VIGLGGLCRKYYPNSRSGRIAPQNSPPIVEE
jgi:hypothetical protein